jgi:hypothetical protein
MAIHSPLKHFVSSWLKQAGFLVVGAALTCVGPNAVADTVAYRGISLKIDSREELADGTVKVSIQSQPILLPRESVERGVVLAYLTTPSLVVLLPPRDLQVLVSKALLEKDVELATKAVTAALSSRGMSADAFGSFLSHVMELSGGPSVVSNALQMVGDQIREQSLCVTLSQVAVDSVSVFSNVLQRPSFVDTCSTLLTERAVVLLQEGQTSQAARHLRALVTLVTGDKAKQSAAVQSYNQVMLLTEALKRRSPIDTIASLEKLRTDTFFSRVSVPAISAIIMKSSEEWLVEGDAAGALYLLSQTDFISRTPQHHNLVLKSLEMLPSEKAAVISRDPIKSGLRLYASKDEAIRAEVVKLIAQSAETLASSQSNGDPDASLALLSLLPLFRPDPSELNDAIRARCATALIASRNVAFADAVLKQMPTGVPLLLRIKAFASSGAVAAAFTFLAAIISVSLVLLAGFVGIRFLAARVPSKGMAEEGDGTEQAKGRQSFVAYPAEYRTSEQRGEYELLLEEFGLPPHASIHDIKLAYRNSVKSVHPDRNLLTGEGQSDEFIELTQKYERLLELLEQRGKKGE